MALTNLPLTTLNGIAPVLNSAGTAIDATNGMTIALASSAVPSAAGSDHLVIYVQNTTASTKTVTVKAGVGGGATPGEAFESSKGDLVSGNLAATTGTAFIGPFEEARFEQLDGSITLNFASGMTGTIWALLVPKEF